MIPAPTKARNVLKGYDVAALLSGANWLAETIEA